MGLKTFFSLQQQQQQQQQAGASSNQNHSDQNSKASRSTATSSNNSFPQNVLQFLSDAADDISSIQVDASVNACVDQQQQQHLTSPTAIAKSQTELDKMLPQGNTNHDGFSATSILEGSSKTSSQQQSQSQRQMNGSQKVQNTSTDWETGVATEDISTLASSICLFSISLIKHFHYRDQSSPSQEILVDGLNQYLQIVMDATPPQDDTPIVSPQLLQNPSKLQAMDRDQLEEMAAALISDLQFPQALQVYSALSSSMTNGKTKHQSDEKHQADIWTQISLLSLLQGDTESCITHGTKALKLNRQQSRQAKVIVNLTTLGLVYFARREFETALQLWREALQFSCLVYGYDHPYNAALLNNLGCLHYYEGDLGISLKTFTESHDLNRTFLAGSSDDTANSILLNICATKSNIATIAARSRSGDVDWAVNVLEEVLSLQSSVIEDPYHVVLETTRYNIDRLMERREVVNCSGSTSNNNHSKQMKSPPLLLTNTSLANGTQGASDAAAVQSCNTFQPVQFEEARPSIFGDNDGIPMRRLGTKGCAIDAIDDTDVLDFLMLGPLLHEQTITQRVRATILNWFGKSLQDDQHRKLTCVPFNGTPRKRTRIPVDLDDDAVLDAEFHLQGINEQATDHLEHDETEEALELFKSALMSHLEKYGKVHHLVGTAHHNIGLVHMYGRDYDKASDCFQEAVAVRGAALGGDHPATASSLTFIAFIHLLHRDPKSAVATFKRVLKVVQKTLGPGHIQAARAYNNIAVAKYEEGEVFQCVWNIEKANKLLRDLLKTARSKAGTPFNQTKTIELALANTLSNLGFLYSRQQKHRESFAAYREADQLQRKHVGLRFADIGFVADNLRYVRTAVLHLDRQEQSEREKMENTGNCLLDTALEDFKSLLRC